MRLDEAKAAAARARRARSSTSAAGEPREETPPFIRRAVAEAVEAEPVAGYPKAEGLPELRAAIATWLERALRRGARPGRPRSSRRSARRRRSSGWPRSSAARARGSRSRPPATRCPRAARCSRARRCSSCALDARRGWLPDLDAVDWDGVAILWLNSPNNPTAVAAPLAFYERAAALAREHGFVLACDEAYSRAVVRGRPAARRALQVADRTNVLVVQHAVQALVDARLPLGLRRRRPRARRRAQALPPERRRRRRRRSCSARRSPRGATRTTSSRPARATRPSATSCCRALRATGLEPAGGDATFFLWLRVPGDGDAEAFALRLLDDLGIVVAPGPFFGPGGEGHVRAALVPTLDECRRAAELLAVADATSSLLGMTTTDLTALAARIEELFDRPTSDLGDDAARDRRAGHDDARRGRDPRRRADRHRLAGQRVGQEGDPALVPHPRDGDDRGRPVRVPRQDAAQDGLGARRASRVVPPATARQGAYIAPGVVLMPSLRERRRVGRLGDDGRHVGDGRLLRADRHRRAPQRRRRDRRRPRAAAGQPGHRRGRRVRRLALRRRRGRARRPRGACSARTSSSPSSTPIIDVRGDEPVELRGEVPPRAVVVPGTRKKAFPAGSTACRARSSSASARPRRTARPHSPRPCANTPSASDSSPA